MSKPKPVINVSIHADRRTEVNKVLTEIKNREMSISATICRLLIEFAARGFKFADKE